MFMFDPVYFIILAPAIILAAWAQWRVHAAYSRAARIRASSGFSGAEAARMILDAHGLEDVTIEPAEGFLGDHYDPRSKTLHLSPDVYQGRSAASLGIAAHESGHAVQDKMHYAPLKLRNGIVPLAAIGSNFSWVLIAIGFALGAARTPLGSGLILVGIGLFALTVFFQVVNLPVEFDASRRAREFLATAQMVAPGDETRAVDKVLSAAALTYVAATLTAILTLGYYLLRSGLLGDRR